MFNILVVEDDKELRELFSTVIENHGYKAFQAKDGEEALDIIDVQYIDLVITDIMMPNMDGYELVKELREADYQMPVLMITAKNTAADKQEGFRAGTDDYMVKPIDVNEMIWRIDALLRRSQIVNSRKITIGETELNCDTLTATRGNFAIELPQKEFYLLYKLAAQPDRIFTRKQIMDDIWGVESETDPHSVDVHVSRLRERFLENPDFDIVTIRGLGYKVVRK